MIDFLKACFALKSKQEQRTLPLDIICRDVLIPKYQKEPSRFVIPFDVQKLIRLISNSSNIKRKIGNHLTYDINSNGNSFTLRLYCYDTEEIEVSIASHEGVEVFLIKEKESPNAYKVIKEAVKENRSFSKATLSFLELVKDDVK
jgi:hypothetical protein